MHGDCEVEEKSNVENANVNEYPCAECKSIWNNSSHVVPHNIQNMDLFFCLNCNDWIQHKHAVVEQGWTLFDEDGYLRQNV